MNDLCTLCPRRCRADREHTRGYCGSPTLPLVARVDLHPWEEPPISGTRGSGTIFFSGCPLRCVFCQNREISHSAVGRTMTARELGDAMLSLEERGAHNLNLVTGTQFTETILEALSLIRDRLSIPVVWNTSGYESIETVDRLAEFVSVWLPDYKYASRELAGRLSGAPDYPDVAAAAIKRMHEHTGAFKTDENGICTSGVLVRHLVLPGERKDSCAALERLSEAVPPNEIRLALMWQYTPEFLPEDEKYDPIRRRVTTFEYESVRKRAVELGFSGFMQDRSAATKAYTPQFDV